MPIFSSQNKQGNLSCNFSYVEEIAVCAIREDSESR